MILFNFLEKHIALVFVRFVLSPHESKKSIIMSVCICSKFVIMWGCLDVVSMAVSSAYKQRVVLWSIGEVCSLCIS